MYKIYCDNRVEADWFRNLSPLLKSAGAIKIKRRGENPQVIDELISYDRPDIILLHDDKPVLVVEKTREVPTGHNVGQRIARLVRAIEMRVPTIKFFPFDAMKHGEYAGACNLNIRLLKSFVNMTEIHQTPILAVNWPCDAHFELIDSGSEDGQMSAIVHDYLKSGFKTACAEINKQIKLMADEYSRRLSNRGLYGDPPGKSVELLDTSSLLSRIGNVLSPSVKSALSKRKQSVLYTMKMTPDKCRREDPYTGTQFIYDYLWCRNGPRVEDKHSNLVLHFPKISRATWFAKNPNDCNRKSCNWYLTANVLVFSNSAELLRN